MSDRYANSVDDILETMTHFGGSFMRHLAALYRVADSENRERIEVAFADAFDRYDEFATDVKASKAAGA